MADTIHEYRVVVNRTTDANPPPPNLPADHLPFESPGSHTASIRISDQTSLVVDVQPQYGINKLEVFITIVDKP